MTDVIIRARLSEAITCKIGNLNRNLYSNYDLNRNLYSNYEFFPDEICSTKSFCVTKTRILSKVDWKFQQLV